MLEPPRNSNHADTRRRRRLSEEAEYHDPNGSAFLAIIRYARDRDSIEAEFRSGHLKFHCSYFAPLAIAVRTNGDVGASQSPCHSYRPPTHQIAASAIRSWRPVKEVTVGHEASPGKHFFLCRRAEETSKMHPSTKWREQIDPDEANRFERYAEAFVKMQQRKISGVRLWTRFAS